MERSASCPRDCVYTGLCTGYLVRRTWLPSFVPNSEGLTIEKNRIACKCNLTIHQPDLRTSKQGDMASPRLRFTMCLGIWSGNQNKLVLQNLVHTCKMSLIQILFIILAIIWQTKQWMHHRPLKQNRAITSFVLWNCCNSHRWWWEGAQTMACKLPSAQSSRTPRKAEHSHIRMLLKLTGRLPPLEVQSGITRQVDGPVLAG